MFIEYAALVTTQKDEEFIKSKTAHIEKSMGFPKGFVEVICNERDYEIPKRGLFNAHLEIYKKAAEKSFKHTAIFQDDVYFLRPIKEAEYADFLNRKSIDDWEAFYLGHRCQIWDKRYIQKTENKNVVKVCTNDLHAYIVSLPCAKKLAAIEWNGVGADSTFVNETKDLNTYALFPLIAIQAGRIGTPAFMNGISERNAQYMRYVTKKPFNLFDAIYYSLYLVVNEVFFFLSSLRASFFHNHGKG